MKTLRRILFILLLLLVLSTAGFVGWAEMASGPSPQALAALQSDTQVAVTSGDTIVFQPVKSHPVTGFIFYPGGRVDYRSYAPILRKIAAQGYLVLLPKVLLNLAFFSPDVAGPLISVHPEIEHWAVGGHSLGGVAAALFALSHPGQVQGIAFWASYPADNSLLNSGVKIVSIYASNDGLATGPKIDASRALLPADTLFVKIAGGNHAQFGSYGPQPGDNPATIPPDAQWTQVAAATVTLLASLGR
jgi:hypothetical protein